MKMLALAVSAPLLLIGAAYPEAPRSGDPAALPEKATQAAPVTYRPCRPGPGDDRCIQLYERGVRASYAGWLRQHGEGGAPVEVAMGGPVEENAQRARSHRRPRQHAHSDAHGPHREMRCSEAPAHEGEARGM
jgi:hypothetical protein